MTICNNYIKIKIRDFYNGNYQKIATSWEEQHCQCHRVFQVLNIMLQFFSLMFQYTSKIKLLYTQNIYVDYVVSKLYFIFSVT